MSLAAAIQVMWVLQIPTWESKCGSQTTQPGQAAKVRPRPVRHTTEDSSQFVFISMWPRFLAVQMQYGCSPRETTCCISEYCPSKALPKMLQTVCWTDWSLTRSLVTWDLAETISMKMDLRYSQLQKCLNLFNPGMPAAPLRLLRVGIEPDKKRKKKKTWHPDHCFPWTNLAKDYCGRKAIQSIEVAISAVIREFKHSTSLQDDTSLNSLSTPHPPARTATWLMTSSSFKPSATSTVCVWTATQHWHHSLHFVFYTLLCLLMLYT